MRGMILAAGLGTRLAPLTDKTPKPLIEIGGEPLIVRQILQLKEGGVSDIVINLHHLGEMIFNRVGNGGEYGVQIQYSWEKSLLETGGGIKNALPLLGKEPFIILNGDIYSDFSFTDLPNALKPDSLGHLVLREPTTGEQAGDFIVSGSKIIGRGSQLTYCGIGLISPNLFINSPEGAFSLRELFFDALARRALEYQKFDGAVGGYRYTRSIGTRFEARLERYPLTSVFSIIPPWTHGYRHQFSLLIFHV